MNAAKGNEPMSTDTEARAEYTPTTDEIREYVEVGGEPRPWEEITPESEAKDAARAAAFDRWLEAHDAELLHPAPQAWEYGLYEEDPHKESERPHRAYNGAHLVSDNRLHVQTQHRKGHPSIRFVRRRKAGPWEPVPQDADRADGGL